MNGLRVMGLGLVFLVGCSSATKDNNTETADTGAQDAVVFEEDTSVSSEPAPPPPESSSAQTDTGVVCTPEEEESAAGWPRVEVAQFVFEGGGTMTGELVATFNHNYWWNNSSPELTFAVFDAERYGAFPDDRSITLVSSRDIRVVRRAVASPSRVSYTRLMRQQGLVLSHIPLEHDNTLVHIITGHESYHREENGFGDYAWDLVLTDEDGARFVGDGTENSDHHVWDAPVVLPIGGYVVEVVRHQPDNTPGFYKPGSVSNYIGVQVGGYYYVYLLHLREGSIPDDIEPGQILQAGTFVGRVGNSGVTLEPHLHMTAFWYDAAAEEPRYWSVPMEFADIYVSPGPEGPGIFYDYIDPPGRSWIASEPFK